MKRLFCLLLCLVLTATMFACSKTDTDPQGSSTNESQSSGAT